MSEDEKKRRLAEMMGDAKSHEKYKVQRTKAEDERAKAEDEKEASQKPVAPVFLGEYKKATYDNKDNTLEATVGRNKHYNQRGLEAGAESFMKR